jgi:hypothetical protein
MFNSGAFIHYSQSTTVNFNPGESICAGTTVYDRQTTAYTKTGTHDYTPGATELNFTTEVAEPPFGPNPPRGDIVFTCHTSSLQSALKGRSLLFTSDTRKM